MARDGEQRAMTRERLEWIEQRWTWRPSGNLPSTSEAAHHVHELLADNERLRAREAALVAVLQRLVSDADATYVDVRPYAGLGHTKIVGPFPSTLEQARALLASAEGSGGDGA